MSLLSFNVSCVTCLGRSASVHRRVYFVFMFLITIGYFWLEIKNHLHLFKHLQSFNFELCEQSKNAKILNFQSKCSLAAPQREKKNKNKTVKSAATGAEPPR